MKNHALFSLKDQSKKLKCCLLQFLFGTLRVNRTDRQSIITSNMPSYKSTDIYIYI